MKAKEFKKQVNTLYNNVVKAHKDLEKLTELIAGLDPDDCNPDLVTWLARRGERYTEEMKKIGDRR